jgi:hypothetical protein
MAELRAFNKQLSDALAGAREMYLQERASKPRVLKKVPARVRHLIAKALREARDLLQGRCQLPRRGWAQGRGENKISARVHEEAACRGVHRSNRGLSWGSKLV